MVGEGVVVGGGGGTWTGGGREWGGEGRLRDLGIMGGVEGARSGCVCWMVGANGVGAGWGLLRDLVWGVWIRR